MRPLSLLALLLLSLFSGLPCQAQTAAEIYSEESLEDTWTPESLFPERWKTDAAQPSNHTGLLGKVYMQQRYLHLGTNDPEIRRIDKSFLGFDSFINLPVMTLDSAVPLDFDLFFSYANVGMKGATNTGPPLNTLVSVNGKSETFSMGTSRILWSPIY